MNSPRTAFRRLAATFHLTHACNLRCSYCYTGAKVGKVMSREVADRAMDFVVEQAREQNAKLIELTFFGGEPLLEKERLLYIVDGITERAGGEFTIGAKTSTNGTLLSKTTLLELTERGVYVSLSVDGPPEWHDRHRVDVRGKGTSELVGRAIDLLIDVNPCAHVQCVLTPETAEAAPKTVDWLYERGFRYITTTIDWSGDWSRSDLDRLAEAFRQLGDWYVDKMKAGKKFYLSTFDARIQSRTKGPIGEGEGCEAGGRSFSVAPSGRLYPCVQFVHEDADDTYVIGDVWNGFDERRGRVRSCSDAPKEECSGCAHLGRCATWCACVTYQTTGRVDVASPLVCELEHRLLPIVDRTANKLWKARNAEFIHKHYDPSYEVFSYLEHLLEKKNGR